MSKKILAGGALAAVLTLGTLGGTAAIASSPSDDDGVVRGSVEAPAQEYENDAREGLKLKGLADISISEAEQAALESQPGEVTKVEIEDEEGYVVYEVEVVGADNAEYELTVDAGNADILATDTDEDRDEVDDEDDNDGDDHYEGDDDDESDDDDDDEE